MAAPAAPRAIACSRLQDGFFVSNFAGHTLAKAFLNKNAADDCEATHRPEALPMDSHNMGFETAACRRRLECRRHHFIASSVLMISRNWSGAAARMLCLVAISSIRQSDKFLRRATVGGKGLSLQPVA